MKKMQNLSIDDLFCVMEFLPVRDLANALAVCKEWNSLDQFEPFWKIILQNFLHSSILIQFRKIVNDYREPIKNWDEERVRKTLMLDTSNKHASGLKEKCSLISALRSFKVRSELKSSISFLIERSLLSAMITSYDLHILKDKTASRESLKKFIVDHPISSSGGDDQQQPESNHHHHHDESCEIEQVDDDESSVSNNNRPSVIGKRFKYLMERQTHSLKSIFITTYFNTIKSHIYEEGTKCVLPFVSAFLGKEIELDKSFPAMDYQMGKRVFSFFLKHHESLDLGVKYWSLIIDACCNAMHQVISIGDAEEVFKKLNNSKIAFKFSFSSIDNIFQNINYFNSILPLVTQLFKSNTLEGDYPTSYLNGRYGELDSEKAAQDVVTFLTYLENFKSREEILEHYKKDFLIHSMGQFGDTYTDKLLELYPFDLSSISLINCAQHAVILKMIQIANKRGISYTLENIIASMIYSTNYYYSHDTTMTIKYVMDNFKLDIFEIQNMTQLFRPFLTSHSYYIDVEKMIESFNILFHDSPIEWKKLALIVNADHEDVIWSVFVDIIQESLSHEMGSDCLEFFSHRLEPNIFDMKMIGRVLRLSDYSPTETLYQLTMYNGTEKLSDHIEKMLQQEDWSSFTDVDYFNYDPSDPRYLISIYRYVQSKR